MPTVSGHPTLTQICLPYRLSLTQPDLIQCLVSQHLLLCPRSKDASSIPYQARSFRLLHSALIHEGDPPPSPALSEPLPSPQPGGERPDCELGKR
jgi:hypothetical protein